MSLLLLVMLATSLANAQTTAECNRMFTEKASQLTSDAQNADTSCTTSRCSSNCRSALNNLKTNFGCCLVRYSGASVWRLLWAQCSIASPTGCSSSSASGVFISVFTVGFVCMFSYIMN